MKRWIAITLILVLLIQALPVSALAGTGEVLTEEELAKALALVGGGDDAPRYYDGMQASAAMTAWQLWLWLDEQLEGDIYSVSQTFARTERALTDLKRDDPEVWQRLAGTEAGAQFQERVQQLQLEAEDLRQTLSFHQFRLHEHIAMVEESSGLMQSAQTYDFERVRYSERIRRASSEIVAIRQDVADCWRDWLEQIDRWVAICDGSVEEQGSVDAGLGDWLGEVFLAGSDPESVQVALTVSDAGALRKSRLSAGTSVLRDAGDSNATLTVISQDHIGINLVDKDGKSVTGVNIGVRDADKSNASLVYSENGKFDVSSFSVDDDGDMELYIIVDAPAASGLRSFCIPRIRLKRGDIFTRVMEQDDGTPYLYMASFNGWDILNHEMKMVYSKLNDQEFEFLVRVQGESEAPLLCYTGSDGKEKKVSGKDKGGGVYTFKDLWKQILTPDNAKKICFRLGTNGDEIPTLLKPIYGVFDKPTDLSKTLSLFNDAWGFSFNIPVLNWTVDIGLKLADFVPKISVDPLGSIVMTIGASTLSKKTERANWQWKTKEAEDWDKLTEDKEKERKKLAENFNNLCNELAQRNCPWMVKGGVTFGFFLVEQGRWQPEGSTMDWSLNGTGGASVTIYGDFTKYFIPAGFPLYLNINISATFSVAIGTQIDFRMVDGKPHNVHWEFVHDFTLNLRIALSVTLGAGIKGLASLWIKGACYFNFMFQVSTERPLSFEITFGASLSVGAELLLFRFSATLLSIRPPLSLYKTPKDSYSLMDTYMNARSAGDGDAPDTGTNHEPETYPALEPDRAKVVETLEDTTGEVRFESLGGDAYAFFIQGRRLHWMNLTKNLSGSIDDVITECLKVYDNTVPLNELTDYAFDVCVASGTRYNQFGERVSNLDSYIALAVLSAKAFDNKGVPIVNDENAAAWALYLWRDPNTGALVPAMNGEDGNLGFYRAAWVGGTGNSVNYEPGKPRILRADYTYRLIRNNYGEHAFSMRSASNVDIQLTQAKSPDGPAAASLGEIIFSHDLQTYLDQNNDNKPIRDSFQRNERSDDTRSDAGVASGAGSDWRRVASTCIDDQSWIAVSRSEKGEGSRGAVELYDWSMNAAGEGNRQSVKLAEGDISEGTLHLLGNRQNGYRYFYTDDVEPDKEGTAYRLKGLRLKPGERSGKGDLSFSVTDTSYDIVLPVNQFKVAELDVQYVLYWLTTGLEDENGNALYRICFAVFDPATNTMSDSFVFAEFSLDDDDMSVRDIELTDSGKWYLIAGPLPSAQSNEGGSSDRAPVTLYTLSEALAPVLDIRSIVLEDLMVRPGDFDNFSVTIMNEGNVAATEMDIEMLVSDAATNGGDETVFETVHVDLLHPENSSLSMDDTQIITGEKAFFRTEDYDFAPKQRDFVLSELTTDYVVKDGVLVSAEKGDPAAQYLTTKAMMPGALAGFNGVLKIPADWSGEKEIKLRVKKKSSSTGWVGVIAEVAGRDSTIASGDVSAYDMITYARDPATGEMMLQRGDEASSKPMLFAESAPDKSRAKVTTMHDLEVQERIYPGVNGEKMLSISVLDLAHTGESIRLYAEIYPDDATEPFYVSLDYYPDAVSDNMTHNYDMRLSALVDPKAYQKARVVIRGIDIEETALSNNEFTLYLDGAVDPLVILSQPRNATIQAGETVSFSVTVSGGMPPYSYQWQVWDPKAEKWVDIPGATSSVLSRDNVEKKWDGSQFRCVITDRAGTIVISDSATLTVRDSVDTGDHTSLPLYLSVAVLALAMLLLLRRRMRQAG